MQAYHPVEALQRDWEAPCYAFFSESVDIEYVDGRLAHVFNCANPRCRKKKIRRYRDKGDASSTSNLRRHVASCWGAEALREADKAGSATAARPHVKTWGQNGTITDILTRLADGKETYSTKPFTALETRVESALWVCESGRPYNIIEDPGFRRLVKTGRPDYPLTSAKTLARDVLRVYEYGKTCIIECLKVSERHAVDVYGLTATWV